MKAINTNNAKQAWLEAQPPPFMGVNKKRV